ncbi:MAG: thiazole biosynthesis protein, partial [Actinobacteria bacterium]|nr:thiazole biosynthesis protein [Actinomycetota bacterium]
NMRPRGDYFIGSSVEFVAKSVSSAVDAGAQIWIGMTVEDIVIREDDRVAGVVINWGAVEAAGLHVDPLALEAKVVIDATGHETSIARTLQRKQPGLQLNTETGEVIGEKSMWAEVGEREIVDNTKEIHKGLLACGMAANAVYGSPRMGAIFGGMLMSGRKAAELAAEIVKKAREA